MRSGQLEKELERLRVFPTSVPKWRQGPSGEPKAFALAVCTLPSEANERAGHGKLSLVSAPRYCPFAQASSPRCLPTSSNSSCPPRSRSGRAAEPDAHAPCYAPTQLSTFRFPRFPLRSSLSAATIGQPTSSPQPINAGLKPPCYWVEQNKNKQSERGQRRSAAAVEAEEGAQTGGPGIWAGGGGGSGRRGQYLRRGSHARENRAVSPSPGLLGGSRTLGGGGGVEAAAEPGPRGWDRGLAASSEPRRPGRARPNARAAESRPRFSPSGPGARRRRPTPPFPFPSQPGARRELRRGAPACPRGGRGFILIWAGRRWEARFWPNRGLHPPRPPGLLGGPLNRRPPARPTQTRALALGAPEPRPGPAPPGAGGACARRREAGPAAEEGAARAGVGGGRRWEVDARPPPSPALTSPRRSSGRGLGFFPPV